MPEVTGEPPMSRVTSLLAHSIPWLLATALPIRAVFLLFRPSMADGFATLASLADAAATLAVIIGMIALPLHLRLGGLCLRCIQAAPLDPETEVRKKQVFLWQVHWSRRRFWLTYAACYLATIPASAGLVHGGVATLLRLPLDMLFFTFMWAFWTHHRLQPWCPYCRGWDEGGEEEVVPDPDPAETKRA